MATNQRNFFLRVEHKKRVWSEYGPLLGAPGMAVYDLLCLHAHSITGRTFVGRRLICQRAKLGPNTVRDSIALLVSFGLIAVTASHGNTPTTYTVLPLPENQDGILPFGQPPCGTNESHINTPAVVLEQPPCGTDRTPLRYSAVKRNKEERTVINEPNISNSGERDLSNLDLWVSEIGHLHPSNLHLKNALLPQSQEQAIAEAISRDGYESVLAGTKNLLEAVGRWPPWRRRYCPNPVKFYRESEYLKNPQLWEHDDGAGKTDKLRETLDRLSARAN